MANKTVETEVAVAAFIHSFVQQQQKKEDSFRLIGLMQEWSGFEARMWGPSIIGFGKFRYKYASGHEGEAPLLAFSPRKAALTLYVTDADGSYKPLLEQLGKYKMSKACIYCKKLDDLDLQVLEQICKTTLRRHKAID